MSLVSDVTAIDHGGLGLDGAAVLYCLAKARRFFPPLSIVNRYVGSSE